MAKDSADELAAIRDIAEGKTRQMQWESEHAGRLALSWREHRAIFMSIEGGVDRGFNRIDFSQVMLSRQTAYEIEMALRAFRKSKRK